MSGEAESYLEKVKAKVRHHLEEAKKAKGVANAIAEMDGIPAPYQIADEDQDAIPTSFSSDEFYGQPLAKCVRRILEARRGRGSGPASVTEIHDALVQSGYLFETKDSTNSKNSLRVSLGKNPIFHKLPNGGWGLLSWYPKAKVPKEVEKNGEASPIPAENESPAESAEGGDEK